MTKPLSEKEELQRMREIIRRESEKFLAQFGESKGETGGNPQSIFFLVNFLDRRIGSLTSQFGGFGNKLSFICGIIAAGVAFGAAAFFYLISILA